jgi:hypothetical protein
MHQGLPLLYSTRLMRVCNALRAVSSYCRMGSVSTYSDRQAAEALRANPGVRQSSEDPTEATAQTVEYMCELIHDSLADGIVQRVTGRLLANGFASVTDCAIEIWGFAKQHVRFVHHQKLLVAWLGAPKELQLLIRPDALLKMREPKGDCAVFTTLICAMCDCAGLPWEIVTIACDPRQPGIYSHVYPRVILPDGRRLVMDASHGKYPGWEVPADHVSAKQVWNHDGQPIEDEAPRLMRNITPSLEGVDMRHLYNMYMPGEGRRGLGQDDSGDDGGDDLSIAVGALDPNAAPDLGGGTTSNVTQCAAGFSFSANAGGCTDDSYVPSPLPVSSSGLPSSAATGASSTAATQLASDIALAATQAAKAVQTTFFPTTAPISTNTLLLIGGVVVGGILLLSLSGKKGR